MQLDIGLEKLFGFKNAAIHVQGFEINGRGLTGNNTIDLFTTGSIEAFSAKLYESWYEQEFDDGKVLVRLGQFVADTEFFISQTATLFINSTYGFPAILANDLPSGGPAYPPATPGARVKWAPTGTSGFRPSRVRLLCAHSRHPGQSCCMLECRPIKLATIREEFTSQTPRDKNV